MHKINSKAKSIARASYKKTESATLLIHFIVT